MKRLQMIREYKHNPFKQVNRSNQEDEFSYKHNPFKQVNRSNQDELIIAKKNSEHHNDF